MLGQQLRRFLQTETLRCTASVGIMPWDRTEQLPGVEEGKQRGKGSGVEVGKLQRELDRIRGTDDETRRLADSYGGRYRSNYLLPAGEPRWRAHGSSR